MFCSDWLLYSGPFSNTVFQQSFKPRFFFIPKPKRTRVTNMYKYAPNGSKNTYIKYEIRTWNILVHICCTFGPFWGKKTWHPRALNWICITTSLVIKLYNSWNEKSFVFCQIPRWKLFQVSVCPQNRRELFRSNALCRAYKRNLGHVPVFIKHCTAPDQKRRKYILI